MLSSSNFGSRPDVESAAPVRQAVAMVKEAAPMLQIDGEMHAETALNEEVRRAIFPGSTLTENANLLVMPNPDVARMGRNRNRRILSLFAHLGCLIGASHPLTSS